MMIVLPAVIILTSILLAFMSISSTVIFLVLLSCMFLLLLFAVASVISMIVTITMIFVVGVLTSRRVNQPNLPTPTKTQRLRFTTSSRMMHTALPQDILEIKRLKERKTIQRDRERERDRDIHTHLKSKTAQMR